MSRNHHRNSSKKNLLLGILAATAVGGIAAAIAGTKKGREFREDLYDAYNNANKKLTRTANTFSNRYLNGNHHSNKNRTLAIGAITGGLLGLTAMMLMSGKSKGFKQKMMESFDSLADKAHSFHDLASDQWDENIAPWVNKIGTLIESMNEQEEKHSGNQPFDRILDLASAAAQLYQSFKK
jgi:gas vesicle protein